MGGIKRRLDKLEGDTQAGPEDAHKQEKERAAALHMAECSNRDNRREGLDPFFEITESGEVFSAHDGRPVTGGRQALCERFYWQHLLWGIRGYDEEAEAFYTPEGEFALSQTDFDLPRLFRLNSSTRNRGEG